MDKERREMRKEQIDAVLSFNAEVYECLAEDEYPYTRAYLKGGTLRTLLEVYAFLKGKELAVYRQKYFFFLDELSLARKVKMTGAKKNAVQYMNMLCCLGVFEKSTPNDGVVFWRMYHNTQQKGKREINTYILRKATRTRLREIETRARRLYMSDVTVSNVSFNKLKKEGLCVIASEVYPRNLSSSLGRKYKEFERMQEIMDNQIKSNGYATRESIFNDLQVSRSELQRLLWIFKEELAERYSYHMPTKQELVCYGLHTRSYIYTARTESAKTGTRKPMRPMKANGSGTLAN